MAKFGFVTCTWPLPEVLIFSSATTSRFSSFLLHNVSVWSTNTCKLHILAATKHLYEWFSLSVWWRNDDEMMHIAWCCSRSSVEFQGHTAKKSSILTQIGGFRTVTPVWIHQWLRNDTQRLKLHKRGSLLFFKIIRQISRSHGTKNRRFWPELSVSGL